jgi:hypothetical protein
LFSPGIPVSSTNKTDRHDITEVLLKVALNSKKKKYIESIPDAKEQGNCWFLKLTKVKVHSD